MNNPYHTPALLQQSIDSLNISENGVYIDATFGGGGHSRVIFEKLSEKGRLIAFDQDVDAHKNAWEADNFILVHSNFQFIKNFTDYLKIDKVDGILADLGLSTHHIDVPERGFSFRFDAPLDMRMNTSQEIDAKYIINTYSQDKIFKILKDFGDVKGAYKIAELIVSQRNKRSIRTTFEFNKALERFTPKNAEHKFLAKIYQAIRIVVNDEINTLKQFLQSSVDVLGEGGRLAVISYHSLEDKLVKSFFKTGNFDNERKTDFYGNVIRPLNPINNKVIVPSDDEIIANNRARSAKLRVAKKIIKQ